MDFIECEFFFDLFLCWGGLGVPSHGAAFYTICRVDLDVALWNIICIWTQGGST